MNATVLAILLVGALMLVAGAWARYLAHRRNQYLRARGYELIAALKAYSAWVDCQRDEPFLCRDADELSVPEPLARALGIKAAFPALSQHTLRLLQAHSRLVEYLWQQNLLRLSQAVGWRPAYQDPQYLQIRGAQEDLIQEMIGMCQEAIGDRQQEWRRTGTDFSFSSDGPISTVPPA
jgi:hypothetical protein